MTDQQHPTITCFHGVPLIPPVDCVDPQSWIAQRIYDMGYEQRGEVNEAKLQKARDQELEACCDWLDYNCPSVGAHHLRAARRPKPPTLAEQGMRILIENGTTLDGRIELDPEDIDTFHAVLKRLKQLEDSND